ncbi:MAG TPA: cysteine desulfurase family protein [Planctomycetota bacterium]|nr:cysteine desulfurase family protein [Planctomycetota bacterium]
MTSDELYFDVNGSTPVDERVLACALAWMRDGYANASAAHPEGKRAAAAIAHAREQIAQGIGAHAHEIFFTSGGTEANNWALFGAARRAGRGHFVASAIEHKSVLASVAELARQGFACTLVLPRTDGAVRAEDVLAALRDDTLLVSIMAANNETGVIQPVEALGAACRARGILFHVDAVGALGKIPLDVRAIACDLLSLSSHKLYSPKGSGILFVREGVGLAPLIHGCGQQGGLRGGSENTPGAVAFGRAFELLRAGEFGSAKEIGALRDALWTSLRERIPGCQRNGTAPSMPNTLNVCFPGADATALVAALGARGISVSAGAAAAKGETSHVLEAMGLGGARARSSLRFSLGAHSTRAGVEALVAALERSALLSESSTSR